MNELQSGDIVLALFPFSSHKGSKVRPCLILAQCEVPEDYIIAYLSSSAFAASLSSRIKIERNSDIEDITGLKVTSYLRVDKLYTLHRSVIVGKIGRLPLSLDNQVKAALKKLFNL